MAQSFKSAFADARRKGRPTFPWQGKQYTTELASPAAAPARQARQMPALQRRQAEERAKLERSRARLDASRADAPPRPARQMPALQRRQAEIRAERDRNIAERAASRRLEIEERTAAGTMPMDIARRERERARNRVRGGQSVGNGRETARGQGVAEDTAAAGDIGRRDRGGLRALERGAPVAGYGGTLTPGQRRGFEQTREAGKFPVYGKQMQAGQSFRAAFADARSKGRKTFPWQGRKYTTDLA
jgi:hypothetical protein